MAIVTTLCTSFKVALLDAEMDFSSDTVQVFKIALYTDVASLGAATTAYTTTGEVASGGGYTTGGKVLVIGQNPTSTGVVAYLNFDTINWFTTTIVARGALVYSTTSGNPSVFAYDFGSNITTSGGTFKVSFPLSTAVVAILRI